MTESEVPDIDWRRVDTVWLDMDGTVLDLYFDNCFWQSHLPRRYADLLGIDLDTAVARLAPVFTDSAGTLPFYCTDFWTRKTGLDMLALKRELAHLMRPLAGAGDALERIAAAGYRLALATNAHPDVLALKLEVTGIGASFSTVVSAHDTGHAKEAPGFWQALVDDYGLAPARALFVDDSPAVVDAALDFGIAQVVALNRPDSQGAPRTHRHALQMPDLAALAGTLPGPHEASRMP